MPLNAENPMRLTRECRSDDEKYAAVKVAQAGADEEDVEYDENSLAKADDAPKKRSAPRDVTVDKNRPKSKRAVLPAAPSASSQFYLLTEQQLKTARVEVVEVRKSSTQRVKTSCVGASLCSMSCNG
ncbi:hypothetical protein TKK_0012474 [Trichogramma kaykai]